MSQQDLSELSLEELFHMEAEAQTGALTAGLLALEQGAASPAQLEEMMRAAHSLKGAARIIGHDAAVEVTHEMEDCFVAAQEGLLVLGRREIDALLAGVDWLARLGPDSDAASAALIVEGLRAFPRDGQPAELGQAAEKPSFIEPTGDKPEPEPAAAAPADHADRVVRVTANNLNRLLGLAGESLLESRWPRPFAESLLRLKRMQSDLGKTLETLRGALEGQPLPTAAETSLADAQRRLSECGQLLADRMEELERFDRRSTNLAHRLHHEVLGCRLRPFADGVQQFPRMVRDVARSLGKEARLEVLGAATEVDRDVLLKLEGPLTHLLRNAVDHGLETPADRLAAGKPAEGTVRLEARHAAGMLLVTVTDDGPGIDLEALGRKVVARALTTAEMAAAMTEAELLDFLFLPGFTMKQSVTEISGRGVGLDAVRAFVQQLRGSIRVTSHLGAGTRFQLTLPLTLSVLRTLLVEIAGEAYAFPLAHITRAVKLAKDQIHNLEGRQHYLAGEQCIGLVTAHQVLERGDPAPAEEVPVVVIGDRSHPYGLVVDRFLGEQELVVQALDPRLGKIKDIAAAALMADGAPALIVDVEDLLRSIEKLVTAGHLSSVQERGAEAGARPRRRVLIVDDSLTVRELERKLLRRHGYDVEVAVDGMDGWNAARTGHFDLIITDVDMPRMDGIELITMVKRDARLKSLPTLIVSYKDRPEDRQRGLEAGADYYLTKGSFHDDTLLHAVVDLIGEAEA